MLGSSLDFAPRFYPQAWDWKRGGRRSASERPAAIRKGGEPIGQGAGGGPGKRRAPEPTLIYLDYLGLTWIYLFPSSSSSERSDLPVVATTPTSDVPALTQTHAVSVPFFDILIKSRFERRATAPQTHPPGKRRLRLPPLCSWRCATVQEPLPRSAFPPKCVPKPELRHEENNPD